MTIPRRVVVVRRYLGGPRVVARPRPRPCTPPPPSATARWFAALRRKHVRVIIAHPHHYATAVGMTVLLVGFGHFEAAAFVATWGYAFIENVTSAVEES